MEDIVHMVSASLARHGFNTMVDHRRLHWSRWCRCVSSLSVLSAPGKAGVFALAEQTNSVELEEKRLLTLFQISECEDLGMALGRLFLPNAPEHDRLSTRPCYVRYAIIEDADQRRASYRALREWMTSSSESSNEIPNNLTVHTFAKESSPEAMPDETLPLARTGT